MSRSVARCPMSLVGNITLSMDPTVVCGAVVTELELAVVCRHHQRSRNYGMQYILESYYCVLVASKRQNAGEDVNIVKSSVMP